MASETQNPPRFSTRGADRIQEFDFTSESWEPECVRMSGNSERMPYFDNARAAKQIRFINKNKETRLRVIAVVQKDTARRWKQWIGSNAHAEVAGMAGGGGVYFGWEPVDGGELPTTDIRCVLGAGDDKNPSRERRIDLPKVAEGAWYVWHAEVDGKWKFAGQGYAQKKRNIVFHDTGEASI